MMKQVFIGAAIVLSIVAIYAFNQHPSPNAHEEGNVGWMTFEEAVEATLKAKQEGKKPKKMFIDVYTDWCGWCKKMDKETFEQPEIAKYLQANFYPVKLNAEQPEDIEFAGKTFKFIANGSRGYHEMAAALLDGKMSYPTTVYLNSEFQLLQRVPGYLDVQTFDMILHYLAEEHYTTTPWADFQQKYLQSKKQ